MQLGHRRLHFCIVQYRDVCARGLGCHVGSGGRLLHGLIHAATFLVSLTDCDVRVLLSALRHAEHDHHSCSCLAVSQGGHHTKGMFISPKQFVALLGCSLSLHPWGIYSSYSPPAHAGNQLDDSSIEAQANLQERDLLSPSQDRLLQRQARGSYLG